MSARNLGHRGKYFPVLVRCYYSEFPISELGEYFRSLTGCIDVMSSSAVTAASRDLFLWVGEGGREERCVWLPSILEGGINQSGFALQCVL